MAGSVVLHGVPTDPDAFGPANARRKLPARGRCLSGTEINNGLVGPQASVQPAGWRSSAADSSTPKEITDAYFFQVAPQPQLKARRQPVIRCHSFSHRCSSSRKWS